MNQVELKSEIEILHKQLFDKRFDLSILLNNPSKKKKLESEIISLKDLINQKKILVEKINEKVDRYFNKGRKENNISKRITCFEKAIKLDPSHEGSIVLLCYAYFEKKEYKKTIEVSELFLRNMDIEVSKQQLSDLFFIRGKAHYLLNKIKNSENDFDKAIEFSQEDDPLSMELKKINQKHGVNYPDKFEDIINEIRSFFTQQKNTQKADLYWSKYLK